MKVVRLTKAYRMYQPGETAGFDDAQAESLIAQGLAVDPEAVKAQAEADAKAAAEKAQADADAKAAAEKAQAEADAKAAAEKAQAEADAKVTADQAKTEAKVKKG